MGRGGRGSASFADGTFDAVLSAFGLMYAPDPGIAAREVFRVVRPQGIVGLTAWPPESLQGWISQTLKKYLAAPALAHEPEEWGSERIVRRRLAPFADDIRVERHRLFMEAATREELWQEASQKVPAQRALARVLTPEDLASWREDWMRLCDEFDRGRGGGIRVEAEYLLVLARREP
jgi:ubiquinone/menaquinone biosynthesis C-methylase UbiE